MKILYLLFLSPAVGHKRKIEQVDAADGVGDGDGDGDDGPGGDGGEKVNKRVQREFVRCVFLFSILVMLCFDAVF